MNIAVTLIAWVVVGVAVGLIEARRGHWSKLAVLTGILGPLAIPLALTWRRHRPLAAPRVVEHGTRLPGDVDVLVGIDGSAESLAAARTVATLLKPRLGRVTLATVLDIETASHDAGSEMSPGPWDAEIQAETTLGELADDITTTLGGRPETVVLAGNPADALGAHAIEGGYDLLVVGPRGRGISKFVFGSCASRLAGNDNVPVLVFRPTVPSNLAEIAAIEERY